MGNHVHNAAPPTGAILLHQQPYWKLLNAFKGSEGFIHAGLEVEVHSQIVFRVGYIDNNNRSMMRLHTALCWCSSRIKTRGGVLCLNLRSFQSSTIGLRGSRVQPEHYSLTWMSRIYLCVKCTRAAPYSQNLISHHDTAQYLYIIWVNRTFLWIIHSFF